MKTKLSSLLPLCSSLLPCHPFFLSFFLIQSKSHEMEQSKAGVYVVGRGVMSQYRVLEPDWGEDSRIDWRCKVKWSSDVPLHLLASKQWQHGHLSSRLTQQKSGAWLSQSHPWISICDCLGIQWLAEIRSHAYPFVEPGSKLILPSHWAEDKKGIIGKSVSRC